MLSDEQIETVLALVYEYGDERVMAATKEAAWNTIVTVQGGREGEAAQLKIEANAHRMAALAHEGAILHILEQSNK